MGSVQASSAQKPAVARGLAAVGVEPSHMAASQVNRECWPGAARESPLYTTEGLSWAAGTGAF